MISHKHKCIFIHIPKCAGTSFEELLGHFDEHEGRAGQDHRSVRMIQKPFKLLDALSNKENVKDTIRRFREYTRSPANPNNALTVTSLQYQSYFKFTVVREPLERAYSWYKNVMRDPIHQKNYNIPAEISFEDFMFRYAGTGYLRPQSYWLLNYSGEVDLDLIIKFEQLQDGFKQLCSQLNIDQATLPHKIAGSNGAKELKISSKVRDFVYDFYADDYKRFGYEQT